MNIKDLQIATYKIACEKGWHDNDDITNPQWIVACLALIGCEVSEAAEAVRDGDIAVIYHEDKHGNLKPEGLGIELADVVLRVFDLAEAMDIDLGACVETKMSFNQTRTHRHGARAL